MVANGGPFGTTDDTNVLYRENGKEQVFVGAIIPILIVHINLDQAQVGRNGLGVSACECVCVVVLVW